MTRFLAALCALYCLAFAAPGAAATVSVATPDGFYAAVRGAKAGDVVSVTAFSGTLDLSNIAVAAPGLTIQPAAGAKIKVDRIIANGTQGITVRGFDVAVTPSWMAGIYAINCARLTFDGLHVYSADGSLSNGGVMFRNCTDGTLSNSELDHLGGGASGLDSANINFLSNRFHDINTDGIDLACLTKASVIGNSFTNFHPDVGAHPDAIQGFCTTAGGVQTDVTIQRNTYQRGSGATAQFIFFENTKNLTITDNASSGSMFNGISVSTTTTADIGNNFIQGWTDDCAGQPCSARIITRGTSSNVKVHDNAAQSVVQYLDGGQPNPGYVEANNTVIQPAAAGDYSAMNAWLAKQGAPPLIVTPPPVVVTQPPAVDPRDAQIAALTTQAASLNAQVAALTSAANDNAAKLAAAQAAATTAQVAAQAASAQLAATQAQLTAAQASAGSVANLQKQLATANAAVTSANTALAKASQKIANAQSALK